MNGIWIMAKTWVRGLAVLVGALCCPALAQVPNRCAIPQTMPKSWAIIPPQGETVLVPLTGYVLALSWSPQFCKEHGDEEKNAAQCDVPKKYGFILHGLWPDGDGLKDPKWCKRVPAVSAPVLKQYFCATPSVGLMQYEWAKHGSCIESDAERYFHIATQQIAALNFPDMEIQSRSQTTVGAFTAAFVAANPGMAADMVRLDVTPLGWLKELRLCLGKDYRPAPCPRDIGGEDADTRLRIWPAR